jgi:hypothetical protein
MLQSDTVGYCACVSFAVKPISSDIGLITSGKQPEMNRKVKFLQTLEFINLKLYENTNRFIV